MITKTLKQGLSLAFILALLVGCTSTDTVDDGEEAGAGTEDQQGVQTGTADRDGVMGSEAEMEELASVVYFDFDQAVLNPEARALLLAHAERLRNRNVDVRLVGHADERGSREYNMALGERRANAVRDFLVLQGVDRNDLEVVSYGEERPLTMGSSESAWAQNRRVEIQY